MKRIGLHLAAILGLVSLSAANAEAAPAPCLAPAEARDLTLSFAPELLHKISAVCAGTLPTASVLRQTADTVHEKYDAEAVAVWPAARIIMARLAGNAAIANMTLEQARPMIRIINLVRPKDCRAAERIFQSIASLPPRNAADLLVTIAELARGSAKGKELQKFMPLCPQGDAR